MGHLENALKAPERLHLTSRQSYSQSKGFSIPAQIKFKKMPQIDLTKYLH